MKIFKNFDKILTLNLKLPEILQINISNTLECHFETFQFTHKSEMKVMKSWSKSEISLQDRGHENFQFLTKFWLNLKLPEILQINKRTL